LSVPLRPAALPTEPLWKQPLTAAPLFPAVIADRRVVVPLEPGTVLALRSADGAEMWRVERAAEQPLAAVNGLVLVATADGVHALEAADGTGAWRAATGPVTAPLLAQDGWVIASSGTQVMALRAADGAVLWTREMASLAAQPSIEGDRLYLPLADGRVVSLVLATGEDRWTRRLGGAPTQVLAFAEQVFVGSADRHFYTLDAEDGSIEWRFRIGSALRGQPAAEGALVLAAALDNLVHAFDRGSGARKWEGELSYRPTAGPIVVGGSVIVPGPARELPSFDAVTGAPETKLQMSASLAAPLTAGALEGTPVLVAITGSATVGWTITLLEPQFGLRVVPITALPGEVVPIRIPPSPPK
jgi:outer membrane protein assembly factor BamB